MLAVLLAGMMAAWPCAASAQAAAVPAVSEQTKANEQTFAHDDAAASGDRNHFAAPGSATRFAQAAHPSKKVETRPTADHDDDEDDDDVVTKKPAATPNGTKSPAQTAQPSRKVETRPAADRDDDDDAVTKKPAAASKGTKSPAQTVQPSRKVETRPAADRDDEDDATVGKQPAPAPKGTKSPAQTAEPPRKIEAAPAADQDDDDDDEGNSKKPALAPEKRKPPAQGASLPKLDAKPSADRDDDAEVETGKPAAAPKEPMSSPAQRPRPAAKVGNKPAGREDNKQATPGEGQPAEPTRKAQTRRGSDPEDDDPTRAEEPAGEPAPNGMNAEKQSEEPAPTFSVDSPTIVDETSAPLSETPSSKKPPVLRMVTWQEIEADQTCFSSWPKNDVPWTCNVLFSRYPDGGPQLEENVRDILVALYDRYPNGHFKSGPRDLGGSGGFLAMLSSLQRLNRKQKLAIIAGVEEGLSLAEKKYPESREMGADQLTLRGLRNLLFVADHPECTPWGPGGPECPRPALPDQYACPADWEARGLQRCCAADVRAPEGVESMDPVLQSVVKKMQGACKCFPQGTYGRYTNPCVAATSEDPGLMTAEQWQRKRMRGLNSSMSGLVSQLGGRDDPTRIAMTNALRNYSMVGKSGGYALGTAVSGFAGVGKCSRHFYNESNDRWWGVGLWNSGFCHIEGGADDTNICMIPPGKSAELSYSNNGNVDAWVMIVSDRGFANKYRLKEAGCKLEPGGNTGDVVLNNPADGDIKTCGPTTYPCRQ